MDGVTGQGNEAYEFRDPVVDDAYDAYSDRAEDMVYELGEGEDFYLESVIANLQKLRPAKYPETDGSWANRLRDHFEDRNTVSDLPEALRSDVIDAVDEVAKLEYLDNPYVSVKSDDGQYDIYGNDDIGYRITRRDGTTVSDGGEIYNLEEAKIQAYTDALDYGHAGTLGESDTLFEDYTLPGGKNYRAVLLTLPKKAMTFDEYAAEYKRRAPGIDDATIQDRYADYEAAPGDDL